MGEDEVGKIITMWESNLDLQLKRDENGGFEEVKFPIVRRVYAKLIMNPDLTVNFDLKPLKFFKKHKL